MNTTKRSIGLSVATALTTALLLTLPAMASHETTEKTRQAQAGPDASLYVGSETCKTCHEDAYKSFAATPHWKTTLKSRHGGAEGCEGCHGPGKAHVEGGGDKSKIFTFAGADPGETSKRCLSCHEYGEEHANFGRSQHSANGISCVACHSPHHAKEAQFLLVQKQPELCYTCHTEVRPDFQQPFRHRVDQGLVQCTDCHNQHGGFLTKQLRATAAQDQVCFKCHADKAGPFTFEHEPVKTEGCLSCHSPHGSTNPRLLKRAQVNLLCLECHTLTQDSGTPPVPSFHNQSQKYSACTMCHPTIHGSNFDAFFLK
ncbi:MAG TPA: DmsE family decaheme c-type cytochrome [Candidatus Dormibacteraeota bacterium]|nr:DmsE family decaheme c-type cytochrome [Candidatus Dormibacteraeota bacterium]